MKDPFEGLGKPTGKTFGEAYDEYIAAKMTRWSESNRERELRHHNHIFDKLPDFKALPIAAIDQAARNKTVVAFEPGSRNAWDVLIYINAVLKMAETGTVRQVGNAQPVKHHEAMARRKVPGFFATLATMDTVESRALRFAILTAMRTSEVIGNRDKPAATWAEIGEEDGKPVWTDPGSRMKVKGKPHRVPLTPKMVALLGKRSSDEKPLFKVRSDDALRRLLRSITGNGDTVHGFRSSFSDWRADAGFPRDLGELCLAHDIRSKVERAYQRGDLLEKRRPIMEAWSGYVAG